MSRAVPTAFELYFGSGSRDPWHLAELEEGFFHSLGLRNGTRKTTWRHRLDDLNALVQKHLPPERPLEIMDVAVSSGVSTAEWLDSLERAAIECRMLAGDAVVDAFVISLGRFLRALVDRTGYLMQLELAGRAIRTPPPRRRDRIRYLPFTALMNATTRLFGTALRTWDGTQPDPMRRLGVTCRPVKLMSLALRRRHRIEAIEDDILVSSSYGGRFHVVRAANILNRAYFDTLTLERMLVNLRARLRPHGLLVVCRTSETGLNNATVFALEEDGRFSALTRLNEGSEITDLVLRLPAWERRGGELHVPSLHTNSI